MLGVFSIYNPREVGNNKQKTINKVGSIARIKEDMRKLKRRVKVRNAVPSGGVQFVTGKAVYFILGEILKGEHMECRGKKNSTSY